MLRPSRRGPTRSEFDGEEKKGIINTIKKLDLHPKAEASTQKKSASGAFVSIFLIVVVLFVFWEESSIYWKPITEDFMFIDTERTEKMKIFLDISFYKMTCDEVSVDAMDNNGEQQIAVEHEIYKTSMREDGEALEHRRQTQLGQAEAKVFLPPDYCGSCFGAAPAGSCCNSCAELRATFRQYGRDISFAEAAPQCLREKKYGPLPGEHGCRVRGTLTVAKMKGNFHVAAGMSHAQGHMDHSHHIHHINLTTINSYDISHHINKLSFGEEYPGMKNPLDGADFIAPGLGNLGYYIQLVPTAYESTTGETVMTNQYSVYEHYTAVDTTQQHYKLPGVFFKYEFWPMRIKYAEQTKPFLPFLIRVCAIIGGLYVIAGICYSLVSSVLSLPKRGSGGSRRGQIFQDMF